MLTKDWPNRKTWEIAAALCFSQFFDLLELFQYLRKLRVRHSYRSLI